MKIEADERQRGEHHGERRDEVPAQRCGVCGVAHGQPPSVFGASSSLVAPCGGGPARRGRRRRRSARSASDRSCAACLPPARRATAMGRARQAELRERNGGEVAHLGAACLVLAVDRLHVGRDLRLVGRTIVAEPAARERVSAAGRGGRRRSISWLESVTLPNSDAPVGQTSQQAGILPCFCR